ncbi:hypothetical protein JCM14124_28550 [Humidesulfovibrio idahonensis]
MVAWVDVMAGTWGATYRIPSRRERVGRTIPPARKGLRAHGDSKETDGAKTADRPPAAKGYTLCSSPETLMHSAW